MAKKIKFSILPQPDDTTCGPTCLHAVYSYYGDTISLEKVIKQVPMLREGGTLAVMLGIHALKRGYEAVIYSYNLDVFDPTWFTLDRKSLMAKLREQMQCKVSKKLLAASPCYLEFLKLGGEIRFEDLTSSLLMQFLVQDIPILTGLSSTYLYKCAREFGSLYNDVQGRPAGHFVVITGYNPRNCDVMISDPYKHNPVAKDHEYMVNLEHLVCAILLGIVTYDANFLVIKKKNAGKPATSRPNRRVRN